MVYLFSDNVKNESDKKHNNKNISHNDNEKLLNIFWNGLYNLTNEKSIIDFIDSKYKDPNIDNVKAYLYVSIYQTNKKAIDKIKNKYDYKVFIKHVYFILP